MKKTTQHNCRENRYRLRLMFSLVLTELLMLALFNFGPKVPEKNSWSPEETSENVEFQQVEITHHEDVPASPPKPTVPLTMPREEVIEEEIRIDPLQESVSIPDEFANGRGEGMGEGNSSGEPVDNPDRPPNLFKIVEPEVPPEAQKANIKAIIEVRFLINATGIVEEASIARIKLYDRSNGEFREVKDIDFGLTEATLNAALQWKFQPAVKNGRKVPAYSIHSFTYGY